MTDNNLDELEAKIKAAKQSSKIHPQAKNGGEDGSEEADNTRVGLRAGMEFVVSIVAGTFIGLWIDNYFGTKPLFLIALFFLGVITGFVNIWRVTEGHGSAIGFRNLNKDSKSGEDTKEP
jgi:ATP synthase protein I